MILTSERQMVRGEPVRGYRHGISTLLRLATTWLGQERSLFNWNWFKLQSKWLEKQHPHFFSAEGKVPFFLSSWWETLEGLLHDGLLDTLVVQVSWGSGTKATSQGSSNPGTITSTFYQQLTAGQQIHSHVARALSGAAPLLTSLEATLSISHWNCSSWDTRRQKRVKLIPQIPKSWSRVSGEGSRRCGAWPEWKRRPTGSRRCPHWVQRWRPPKEASLQLLHHQEMFNYFSSCNIELNKWSFCILRVCSRFLLAGHLFPATVASCSKALWGAPAGHLTPIHIKSVCGALASPFIKVQVYT